MIKYFFLIPLWLLLPLLTNCSQKSETDLSKWESWAMHIPYKVMVADLLTEDQKRTVEELIASTFRDIDRIYNNWNPHSEISLLNQLKAFTKTPISSGLADFLRQINHIYLLSDGLFDPTVAPLQKAWKEALARGSLPDTCLTSELEKAVGWHHIYLEDEYFWKDHDLTSLDLCGIVKGYCVDLMCIKLNFLGFKNVYVEWGGEIRATGRHSKSRPWQISIRSVSQSDSIPLIELTDQAIATSGDYEQNWRVIDQKEKIYCHIYHPKKKTLLEVQSGSIASASVIAGSCMRADALATICMLFGSPKEATTWIERTQKIYPDTKFWLLSR